MKITPEQVKHLSKLSWIEVSQQEVLRYSKELTEILEYVDKLDQLKTENIEPTYHVMAHDGELRADQVKPSLNRDEFLAVVPSHEDGAVKVPKIINPS